MAQPDYSFWGCFFLTSQKLFVDENSTTSQNYPPKMINLSPKFIISPVDYKFPKNVNLRVFLSNCRESLVRAFRKKTPLSVRRPWGGGGAKGGTGSVHRNVTFFS